METLRDHLRALSTKGLPGRTPMLLLASATGLAADGEPATVAEPEAEAEVLDLPYIIGSGDPREVSVLLDEDHLKLATITLRGGTELPPHSAPAPTTIQVLEGRGVVHVEGRAVPVSRGSVLSLAAGKKHDVVPAEGTDMLLLVHYLRCASERPGDG